MIKLKNDFLAVEIDNVGAQLTHVIDLATDYDYIWNGKAWSRHAPILFPSIGKSNNDQYQSNGQTYEMPQHGFARDFDWQKVSQTDTKAVLELKANPKTKVWYDFNFVLQVEYSLDGRQLKTNYKVINQDEKTMPFALGSHPGFNVPLDNEGVFEDYELSFSPIPKQVEKLGIGPVPFRDGTKSVYDAVQNGTLKLNHEMFDDGLIILDAKKIDQVQLSSDKTAHAVTLNIKQFPYLTLWTKENDSAPFLCIEPFAGLPDQASAEATDWMNKKGNNLLEAGESQNFEYSIEFK